MPQLFNLSFLLKDMFHIEREQLECIQLYLSLLHRSASVFFPFPTSLFAQWYHTQNFTSVFLSLYMQVVIEFPYVFGQALIYCSIFYSMASFEWTAVKFISYIFFMYFTMLYFTFYGMMTTAITPNHNVAAIIAAPCYMLWNLFSGFMIAHKVPKLPFLFLVWYHILLELLVYFILFY